MAMRKTTKLHAVAVRRRVTGKKGLGVDGEAGNREPLTAQRVIEFPQPPAVDDMVSDTIIFDIGGDRFAIKWSAEIELLPPAGPVVVERKRRLKFGSKPRLKR